MNVSALGCPGGGLSCIKWSFSGMVCTAPGGSNEMSCTLTPAIAALDSFSAPTWNHRPSRDFRALQRHVADHQIRLHRVLEREVELVSLQCVREPRLHPGDRANDPYIRPEFVQSFKIRVITTRQLFDWRRVGDSAASLERSSAPGLGYRQDALLARTRPGSVTSQPRPSLVLSSSCMALRLSTSVLRCPSQLAINAQAAWNEPKVLSTTVEAERVPDACCQ